MSKLTPNEGILNISPYIPGKSNNNPNCIKLSSNENALGFSPKAELAYQKTSKELHRYPDPGCSVLANKLAHMHNIKSDHIIFGAGSEQLISLLAQAYVSIGSEVIMPKHSFIMHKIATQANGGIPIEAECKNLTMSVDNILAEVTPKTKMVFLANPNNPTGTHVKAEQIFYLRSKLRDNILLIIDAAYAEFCSEDENYFSMVEKESNTVVLRTFSKAYGLSGLRIGWGYCPKHIIEVLHRIRGPFNVCSPAQSAALAALEDQDFIKKSVQHNVIWLDWMYKQFKDLDFVVEPSYCNFLCVNIASKGYDSTELNKFLNQHLIFVRPIQPYNLPEWLRITIGTEHENKALIKVVNEFINQSGK